MLRTDSTEGFKKAGIPRHYSAGEPIVLVNEPSTGMYLIIEGQVKVVIRQENGELLEVATISAGQTMGEISLLLGQPHSATIIAKTDVEASLLTPTKLEELRESDHELALILYEILAYTLAGHLMDMNRQMAAARQQIAQLKAKVADQTDPTYSIYY